VLLRLDCHVTNLSASLEISLSHQAVYYYLLDNPVSGPLFVPTVIAALHPSNTGVFAMELHCEFWCKDFGSRLPGVVFAAVSFPLDEVLESSLVPTTVEYFLHLPLCFSIDDYRQWVVLHFASCNWVVWSQSELYYIEH